MSTLRIFAPAAEGGRLRWARLDDEHGTLAPGGEADLALIEGDSAVELILPAARVQLIPAEVSKEQRSRLSDENLPWLAEPYLVQEVERLHIVRGHLAENGRLTLCVVERAWLDSILRRLAGSRIRPNRIVPEILLTDWRPGDWVVVLKPDGGFVRTGEQQGYTLDAVSGGGVPTVLTLALKNAALAGQLRVYWADTPTAPDCSAWTSALGVPVQMLGSWSGLAPLPATLIDLASGPYAPPGQGSHLRRRLRPTFWLAAAVVLLNLGGMALGSALGFAEKARVNGEIEALLRKTFPQTTTILDPLQQMRQGVDRLSRETGVSTRSDFIPLLGASSAALGAELAGRLQTLSYESGTLLIEVTVPDAASIEKLKTNFAQAGLTAKIDTVPSGPGSLRVRVSISA